MTLTTCRCGRCPACRAEWAEREIDAEYDLIVTWPVEPSTWRETRWRLAPLRPWENQTPTVEREPWSDVELAQMLAEGWIRRAAV